MKLEPIFNMSSQVQLVLIGIFTLLILFTLTFQALKKFRPKMNLKELIDRTTSWWKMLIIFVVCIFINKTFAIIMIGFLSFIALREMLSTLNFRTSDRRSMFWCYLVIPFQFYSVYIQWYGFFIILIPVIMFMILPFRNLITGDTKGITNSNATLQWSLMITVFSLSHLAYLLVIPTKADFRAGNEALVLYLIFLTQFNDVLQFLWGKAIGKRKIAPKVSPNKTWEGFLGGLICTTLLAYLLRFLTPFTPIQSLIAGFMIAFSGFVGDLNISAIKRDLELKDMGNTIPGHGGIMDRLDSLSFASLVFFHLAYYWRPV